MGKSQDIDTFLKRLADRDPCEKLFQQAVEEVIRSVYPAYMKHELFQRYNILERIVEPNRVIQFKVTWMDDNQNIQVNRGYRVEFNNALGPYKGGQRFHPSVNLDVLKFLGFEQIFKNALTELSLGGAKGGSNFDPKGKSENEVMHFCQSFMMKLSRHIGPHTDVPAGDIGVGSREIGYMFGMYKQIMNRFDSGVLTGKKLSWGGSQIRPEATGYGLVYFVLEMLGKLNFAGKTIAISGSGNVAQFTAEKAHLLGGKVVTLSDSDGTIYDPDGIDEEKLKFIMKLKNEQRGRIKEYAGKFDVDYFEGKRPWRLAGTNNIKHDIALPCATENELDEEDALCLIENDTQCIAEGSNMSSTPEAVALFHKNHILYGPGKATNAGGVAVSGLEMAQDQLMLQWTREMVDERLHEIMIRIHNQCVEYGTSKNGDYVDYVAGANIAGFMRVAGAMIDHGVV